MQGLLLNRISSSKPPVRIPNLLKAISLILPLLSCAVPQRHIEKPRIQETRCALEDHDGDIILSYERAGQRSSIKLDVNEFKPIALFCQRRRTIIVTGDKIIRSLGYDDITAGMEMIGALPDANDRFRPENVVVLGIAPLESGNIIAAMVSENILTIVTESGVVWRVDVDKPTEPVMRVGLADSKEFLKSKKT
ncbi:hypothetical protein J4450_00605 [Candidatus Micrarchaeota archaeon]|nr:hypothetical protein [Candidatus Micrarchaeota archaeon]